MSCGKILITLLLVFAGLTSCRTTEANYRAAYEVAKASQERAAAADDDGLDENTRRMLALNHKNRQSVQIVGSDTLNISTIYCKLESGPTDTVPQYAVVANAFSQVFNANALRERLQQAGFKDAYILRTSTPDFYVAAAGSDNVADIPAIVSALAQAGNPGSRAGFPAVVRCVVTGKKKKMHSAAASGNSRTE